MRNVHKGATISNYAQTERSSRRRVDEHGQVVFGGTAKPLAVLMYTASHIAIARTRCAGRILQQRYSAPRREKKGMLIAVNTSTLISFEHHGGNCILV